jgi:hypothetical protein
MGEAAMDNSQGCGQVVSALTVDTRIIGYDNAHGMKLNKKKFGSKKTEWDHKHEKNRVKSYEFESAAQLLEDFWNSDNIVGNY